MIAENGKPAFVTSVDPLLPGVTYTINISAIIDAGS